MSNLSELLPAGAGAKSADFVASGTLGSGVTVALKSDGTVEAAGETTVAEDIPVVNATTFDNQATQYHQVKADPHNSNRWAAVWTDDAGTKYVRVAIFTRSGSSITVSPISNAFTGGNASEPAICFDPDTAGKFILTFNNTGNDFSAIVGTFSGTAGSETFSYGSSLTVDTGWQQQRPVLTPTGTSGDFINVARNASNSGYSEARILTVSGTTVTATGSTVVLNSVNGEVWYAANPTDSDEGVGLFTINNTTLKGRVLSLSGTGITVSSETVLDSGNNYDDGYNPSKIAQIDASNYLITARSSVDDRLYAMVLTNSSGTLTTNTRVLVSSATTDAISYHDINNNLTTSNNFVVSFRDRINNVAYATVGTLSGTAITINTNVALGATNTNLKFYYSVAQQSGAGGSFLLIGGDSSLIGQYVLGETGSTLTNSADFIGITDQAIADTATGAVIVQGGVSEKLTGLTVGADYYVQDDGSLQSPTVSAPYDISASVFVDSFSVATQDTSPSDVVFNNDGTKMFVVGYANDAVYEYTLSTGFDISTATYSQNFSVTSQDTYPTGIAFNTDGTKMFVVGQTGDAVYEYTLSTGFDVSTSTFSQSFSVASQELNPQAVTFNNDGTKMYVCGFAGDDVNEYTLSTGFDISTASYSQNFSVASEETTPTGVRFNTDGTKMFISGAISDSVHEYALSTGFDVSTASYSSISFSVASQDATANGIAFNNDGTKMYIAGNSGNAVYEYSTSLGSVTSVPAGRALSTASILLEG